MGERLATNRPFTCVTCEIEIAGPVTFHLGLPFCCAGCVAGGPCICSYDDATGEPIVRHCLDIEGASRSRGELEGAERLAVGSR